MNTRNIHSHKNEIVHVVIETPQYSTNTYGYDPDLKVFKQKQTLPGSAFPFDFGFVPNTLCEDGDPLDVLVLIEGQTYPGCLLTTRLIGILEAQQADENAKPIRNDRLIAISVESQLYSDITDVKELDKDMIKQMENFFIDYNKREGRIFKPLRWGNAKLALKKIHACKD